MQCPVHADPTQCPDSLIQFEAQFREYGLRIHDGGESAILIAFCPWCGASLPASLRDRWFDELAALGFDEPFSQSIPEPYRSDAWHVGS